MRITTSLAATLSLLFFAACDEVVDDEPCCEAQENPDADASDGDSVDEIECGSCPQYSFKRIPSGGMDGGGDGKFLEIALGKKPKYIEVGVRECIGDLEASDLCNLWEALEATEYFDTGFGGIVGDNSECIIDGYLYKIELEWCGNNNSAAFCEGVDQTLPIKDMLEYLESKVINAGNCIYL